MTRLLLTLFLTFYALTTIAQITWLDEVAPEIKTCHSPEVVSIAIRNDFSTSLSGVSLSVELPPGIYYQLGSLSLISGVGISEGNVTDLNQPQFVLSDIIAGDSIVFNLQVVAETEAIAFQEGGGIFRNAYNLNYNQGSDIKESEAYNILYPSINITSLSPVSQTAVSGEQVYREITIVNAGYGSATEFYLTDVINSVNLSLIDVDKGVLSGDTIFLSAIDFVQIGNQDNYFDLGETIVVKELLSLNGCNVETATSSIQTYWGCGNAIRQSDVSFGHVTIDQKTPSIKAEANAALSSCFGAEVSPQQLIFNNKGFGVARGLHLEIYKSDGNGYNEDIYSRLSTTSFEYSIGVDGAKVGFNPVGIATRNDGLYNCLGNAPIGKITYDFPFFLSPGDSLFVYWDIVHCCISECDNQGIQGWEYALTYTDFCQNNAYSINEKGEEPTKLNMTIFTETIPNVDDGETIHFNYYISSHDNSLPDGPGAHYEIEFTIPDGLVWSGNGSDLSFHVNALEWLPISVNYNNGSSTLVAKYPLPAPFQLEKSAIDLLLTGDCSNTGSGVKSINMNVYFSPDSMCLNGCKVDMVCNTQSLTNLHCPVTNCEGVHFYAFDVRRTSAGRPDNDLNGLPDLNGQLDETKIKRNRMMFGDTMTMTYSGKVGSSSSTSYDNLFAESKIEKGSHLEAINATIMVFDSSDNIYRTCDQLSAAYFDNGSIRTFRWNIVGSTLAVNCLDFTGSFQFEKGDSVWIQANYRVIQNLGGLVEELAIDNDLFLSQLSNPWLSSGNRFGCDAYNGRFTLIGYFFANNSSSSYNLTSCSKVIRQNFGFSIGDCCDNYSGGNLFPYEYRNWAHLKQMQITIPEYYEVTRVYFNHKRTKSTNQKAIRTVYNLSATGTSPVTLDFDLEQYYKEFGGILEYSDDGFNGTVFIELAPTCDVAINQYEDIEWKFKFEKGVMLGGGSTSWITASAPDRIKYNPTTLELLSNNPIQDGLGRTVTWNLNVQNTTNNSDASNTWVHFKSPSGDIDITDIVIDGDTLMPYGDVYQIGTVNRNSSQSISVTAKYSGCEPDYIVAYSGYECTAYPDSFTYFNCPYTTYSLGVVPKVADRQVRVAGETIGGVCSNMVQLSVELASVKFGYLDSIELDVFSTNNSAVFAAGSGELLYPLSGHYDVVADPVPINGGYKFTIADLNSVINDNGLPGVTNLSSNTLRLRFQMELEPNFRTGDYILIQVKSKAICGTKLPVVQLVYDPSVKLDLVLNSGLTQGPTDTWGVSWVDYDLDGWEDCFVSSYDPYTPNKMYRNNGDGTFSEANLGGLTSTLFNTVSSTWGDVDNDGDPDVYLSNNVGSANAFYENAGNGIFTYDPNHSLNNYGGYCHNATWVDYDNDGWLDLFVSDYMPTKFNHLYRNNQDGSFTAVTASVLTTEAMKSIGTTWGDYDNDGDLDAFVPNTNGANNCLYRNDGNGTFVKITDGLIVNDGGNSVGCSWGDYDNDQYLDLLVVNTGDEANFLYTNNGGGSFTKELEGPIVTDVHNSSGSSWVDVDNDGDLDLYVTSDLGDPSVLYINQSDGTFNVSSNALSTVLGNAYPNAWADYDNDGDMDVFVGTRSGEFDVVFENAKASCNSWVCISLEGSQSNKSAIGAKIKVKSNIYGESVWQMRELSAQTGGGAGSQNGLKTIFGMGDAISVDSLVIEWPSGQRQSFINESINNCKEIVEPLGNKVCGIVYNDANQNCVIDDDESGIPGVLIEILPGPRYISTDNDGTYSIYLEDGNYSLKTDGSESWSGSCLGSSSVNLLLNGQDTCGNNFKLHNNCFDPDLAVELGTSAMRRGFQNQIIVNYYNHSSEIAFNSVLYVEFDSEVIPLSASLPWSGTVLNDSTVTYFWNLDTLKGFAQGSIQIVDSVTVNAQLEETVFVSAYFDESLADCDLANNRETELELIVGSVDPNDKLVSPGIPDQTTPIESDTRLTYKIRFQNVGNYYASRVVIRDELSPYLDLSTIKLEGHSHPFTVHIEEGVIVWEAYDIVLPDSTTNLIGSQGFVKFSAMPLATTPHLALIENSASIQFDYNEPLITNTVTSQIIIPSSFEDDIKPWIYPNPGNGEFNLFLLANEDMKGLLVSQVELYNPIGQKCYSEFFANELEIKLKLENLPNGVYLVKVRDSIGRWTSATLVKHE